MIEDDVHDQLVKEYLAYFKANEIFLQRPSEAKRRVVRKHLSQIMKLAKVRRLEIQEIHKQALKKHPLSKTREENL